MKTFQALTVEKENDNVVARLTSFPASFLPVEDILIDVAYSSVNYKDFLATQNKGGVVTTYPMIPGIDLAGTITQSRVPEFVVGQKIIATSFAIGVSHYGGFSELASVKKEWALPLPSGLTLKESMLYGTAGLTAALSIMSLEKNGMTPDSRVLITGATGGVASIARLILEHLGYSSITLMSQKNKNEKNTVATAEFLDQPLKVLGKQTYDYVIDSVGGDVLAHVLPLVSYGGAVASFGNAGGFKLNTTVFPFILRGINLLGIDSVNTPQKMRLEAWQNLATRYKINFANLPSETVTLAQLPDVFASFKEHRHSGRTLISIGDKS